MTGWRIDRELLSGSPRWWLVSAKAYIHDARAGASHALRETVPVMVPGWSQAESDARTACVFVVIGLALWAKQ